MKNRRKLGIPGSTGQEHFKPLHVTILGQEGVGKSGNSCTSCNDPAGRKQPPFHMGTKTLAAYILGGDRNSSLNL